LHTYLADPDFQAALHEAEAGALAETTRRLLSLSGAAADALAETVTGPAPHCLRAADLILVHLVRLRQYADLEQRVAALEESYGTIASNTR
jgi:hypothetical protein